MSNILNNTTGLQEILEALQNKASGGGEPTPSQSVMINIDVTVMKGDTVYYFNENKEVCSVTGTAIKGNVVNVDAYLGILCTDMRKHSVYGKSGNYLQVGTLDNWVVVFLESGGTASTFFSPT